MFCYFVLTISYDLLISRHSFEDLNMLPITCPFHVPCYPRFQTILSFLQEALQQESKEIREGVELSVPSYVLVSKFDTVFHVWIWFPLDFVEFRRNSAIQASLAALTAPSLDKIVQWCGGIVFSFHFNGHQWVGIAHKEVHFEGRVLALVEILIITFSAANISKKSHFCHFSLFPRDLLRFPLFRNWPQFYFPTQNLLSDAEVTICKYKYLIINTNAFVLGYLKWLRGTVEGRKIGKNLQIWLPSKKENANICKIDFPVLCTFTLFNADFCTLLH